MRVTQCRLFAACVLIAATFLVGCGGSSSGPSDRIVAGVNITELVSKPTASELSTVQGDWELRDTDPHDATVVATLPITLGSTPATLRVYRHTVDTIIHYGAVIVPDNADPESLPILVYAHESDEGIDIDALLPYAATLFGGLVDEFVFVAPSYRSEPLTAGGHTYISTGAPSPWDRDVDDLLSLLNLAIDAAPEADTSRIGIIGFSRGATVAMLATIRDPRFDLAVCYYGPSDFLGPWSEELIVQTLEGDPPDLPNVDVLNETLIQPLADGDLTIPAVRDELIRRSPIHFAAGLPPIQLHHNTGDTVVPVGETERLVAVLEDLGRTAPDLDVHYYSSSQHFPHLFSRTPAQAFLRRLLDVPVYSYTLPQLP